MKHLAKLTAALICATALPAFAGDAWESVREQLYGDRVMQDGAGIITVQSPYRTTNDARTEMSVQVTAPTGLNVGKVTLVLDDNPMPVSAVFDLNSPQPSFYFDVTMRVNGPTPLHVIAETTDGRLWVIETFVKTSGQGACSAPPATESALAMANLGLMDIGFGGAIPGTSSNKIANLTARVRKLDVAISHPSHSGMQMNQISLLYIPMRYIETVRIALDGADYVELTGSISLSENPQIGISVPSRTRSVDVTMTDTSGSVSHLNKRLAGG